MDTSTAWRNLNAHFGRLGFSSLSGPRPLPLQIGAQVILHDLEVSELNGACGVVHEALDRGNCRSKSWILRKFWRCLLRRKVGASVGRAA